MTSKIVNPKSVDVRLAVPICSEARERGASFDVAVLNALHCGVIVTDREGRVQYMNPAACALTGWPCTPTTDTPISDVLRIDTDAVPRRRVRDSLFFSDDAEPRASELTSLDGSRHSVEIKTDVSPNGGHVVYEIRDIGASVRRTERLIHEATHDSLTGLINRRELQRHLYELVNGNDNENHILVMLDLDGFKRINDECGHLAGDEVLHAIAGLLQGKKRRADFVARLGGDEFAVLLIGCLLDEALNIAEEMRRLIADYEFESAQTSYRVTASLGLACVNVSAAGISQIMQRADSACYRAKSAGGNQVCVHDGKVLASQYDFEKHSLEPRLRQALAGGGLIVHGEEIRALAQSDAGPKCAIVPGIRAATGRLVGPDVFMPVAARSGMALELDRWLIAHTLRVWRARTMQNSGQVPECFVSLSRASLDNAWTTAQYVDETLARYSIPTGTLCIEVKERDAIANWATTAQLIERLKGSGVRFCLNEFGVGLYTLAYLKRAPIDYIKLPVELLDKATAEPFYSAYILSIINVAGALGIEVIGMGAETDDAIQRLQCLGVQYIQDRRIQSTASFEWVAESHDQPSADFPHKLNQAGYIRGAQSK